MSEQRRCRRRTAAKAFKDLAGMHAAAECEHGVSEAGADGFDACFVVNAGVFEGAEGIGRQHFCPFVAVVAGRVATREDVTERAEEAVFVEDGEDGVVGGDVFLDVKDRLSLGQRAGVYREVDGGKHQLAQHHARDAKGLCRFQFLEQLEGRRGARSQAASLCA